LYIHNKAHILVFAFAFATCTCYCNKNLKDRFTVTFILLNQMNIQYNHMDYEISIHVISDVLFNI
ncbi:hypothetical protein ACJX0J_032768, partial [Zea mays]